MKLLSTRLELVVLLFFVCISCGIVYLQSTRKTPLVDYGYQIEIANRIYQGEVPYKDFFLVLPPGSYWILSALMTFSGGYSHALEVFSILFITTGIVVFLYYILHLLEIPFLLRCSILSVLLVTGHSIFPVSNYDIDASLFILISIACLLFTEKNNRQSPLLFIFAGSTVSLPFFFKQNTGVIFYLSIIGSICLKTLLSRKRDEWKSLLLIILGSIIPIVLFSLWLLINTAFHDAMYQLFIFPQYAASPWPSVTRIIDEYTESLLIFFRQWMFTGSLIAYVVTAYFYKKYHAYVKNKKEIQKIFYIFSVVCLVMSFIGLLSWYAITLMKDIYFSIVMMFWCGISVTALFVFFVKLFKDKFSHNSYSFWIILPLIASVHATFLSHSIVGSSYGMWPLGLIMIIWLYMHTCKYFPKHSMFGGVICICVIIGSILVWSIISQQRLDFFHAEGNSYTVTSTSMKGISTPGDWLPEMESMFAYVEEYIPKEDSVAFFPGEDPFYAVTGRKNPLPYVQLNTRTFPQDTVHLASLLKERNVKWVIIKTTLQCPGGFLDMTKYIHEIEKSYNLIRSLKYYQIYQNKNI